MTSFTGTIPAPLALPARLEAGQGFSVPARKVHQARNVGTVPVQLIAACVVERGKPIASQAR